ncbi:transcriptional regulator, AlpA family [Luteibacter sp. UNCMF331Sha3.1]|nr:transcriptional regulator, AlpA family [Luteibacter sp. UNCMF331Sha3.1]
MPHDIDALPDSTLLREKELVRPEGILPFARATLWRHVRDGSFPQPIRLPGVRMTCWRVGDVRAWLAAASEPAKAA